MIFMATRYIKLFETETQYNAFRSGATYVEPHGSGIVETRAAHYSQLSNDEVQEYTPCQYIQNTSDSYINTGVKGDGSQRIECVFMPITKNTGWNCVYGARDNAGVNDNIYIYSNTDSKNYTKQGYVGYYNTTNNSLTVASPSLNVKHTFIQNRGTFTLDGATVKTYTNATFTSTANTFIFDGSNNNTRGNYKGLFRLYSFKMYINNILVRDFIPVKRNSDNKFGLYDLVNRTYYTSASSNAFAGA